MKTNFEFIITHDGIFHADEVFAIAILAYTFQLSDIDLGDMLVRTRDGDLIEKLNSKPNYGIVIDVGGKLNPSLLQFDHHQYKGGLASAGLVLKNLKHIDGFNWFAQADQVRDRVYDKLIKAIDQYDTGELHQEFLDWNQDKNFLNLSQTIAGFNRGQTDDAMQKHQMIKAVMFAKEIVANSVMSAVTYLEAKDKFFSTKEDTTINNITFFSEFIPFIREIGKEEGVLTNFFATPNPQGWALHATNSSEYPIPEKWVEAGTPGLIFAHKAKFIAVFADKESLLSAISQ